MSEMMKGVYLVDNLITRNLSCDQVVYKEKPFHHFVTTGATEKSLQLL